MNSPKIYLIPIFVLVVLCQVESLPSNKIPCHPSNVGIKPCAPSQKMLIEYSVRNKKGNPEEKGPYFEGDIIISGFQRLRKAPKKWSNGTVPYQIAETFSE